MPSIRRIHKQVNRVYWELIQVAWIQVDKLGLGQRNWLHFNLPYQALCAPLVTPSSPHPVCLPLRCVFQCNSWAITQLSTGKYPWWFLMSGKSLPAHTYSTHEKSTVLETTRYFAVLDADSSIYTVSHCAVTQVYVYFVHFPLEVKWLSLTSLPHGCISGFCH